MRIRINGLEYRHFNNLEIGLSLDKIASSFSFVALFNPDNSQHRSIFKPLSYPKVEIFSNENNLILTGIIVNNTFNSSSKIELSTISGYSLAGVLEHVKIPLRAYPLESLNRSIADITKRLLSFFDLNLKIEPSLSNVTNEILPRSVASPTESIKSYISKLASQKNIVLSHNERGDLTFIRPDVNSKPTYFFNKENVLSATLSTQGEGMHSEVSVIRQPSISLPNASTQDSVSNPMVTSFRPSVSVLTSGDSSEVTRAANNKLAKELMNIKLVLNFERTFPIFQGQIVEVQNDKLFLFSRSRFLVKEVKISSNQNSDKMSVSLVLPESFTGETPKNVFE